MPTMVNNPMNGLDARNPDKPGIKSFVITPDDANDLVTGARFIYVGVAGDVKLTSLDDDAGHTGVVLKTMPVGLHRISARRVYAAGTTATNLVGFA